MPQDTSFEGGTLTRMWRYIHVPCVLQTHCHSHDVMTIDGELHGMPMMGRFILSICISILISICCINSITPREDVLCHPQVHSCEVSHLTPV